MQRYVNNMSEQQQPTFISYRAEKEKKSAAYKPFIYALILSFGVMMGYMVNQFTAGKQQMLRGQSYNKLQEIVNYIERKYVDTVNTTDVTEKAIDKLLSNLDPHSVYIPAKDMADVTESLEGNFEGIGIEFFIVQDTITVVTAISGGPAEMAGMKAGDRIVMIDDTIVAGIKIKETDVKKKLRGPKGTTVKVGVLRANASTLKDIQITRNKIPLYSVDAAYMINSQTGLIRISNFSSTTYDEFVEKMNELLAKGMSSLIIDLRGNPGGFLQAATYIADELLDDNKLLVYTQGKAYDRQEYRASRKGLFEKGSLAILIDQGSASASEILAGAVQDWDRGTIVGRTSFGKGLVQEQIQLRDGSALRLTVARYYTPSGRSIQRPYNNGTENYFNEVYERYMRGEMVHEDTIKAVDTLTYKTAAGRKVFGGGGIRADVFVPIDTAAENEQFLTIRSYIQEFVYKYSSLHPEVTEQFKTMESFKNGFDVDDALLQEFYQYASQAGMKKEGSISAKTNERVKLYIKAFIAKQNWRMNGFYYIINVEDKAVRAALEAIKK